MQSTRRVDIGARGHHNQKKIIETTVFYLFISICSLSVAIPFASPVFKICSIGTGNWATFAHGPSLQHYSSQRPGVELAACCSLDAEQARRYQASFGYSRSYTDFEEMLALERPQAVTVVLPMETAAELVCRVMAAGYPVLMEKPPGANPGQTRRLMQVAAQSGVANMVAFNRRYSPGIQRLRDMLANRPENRQERGRDSSDVSIELQSAEPSPVRHVSCDFYRYNRRDDNFEMAAIHGIDATRHLAGSGYKTVNFSYQSLPHLGSKVAHVFMDCSFESGATAQLRLCPTVGVGLERYTVHTDRDTFFLDMPDPYGIARNGRLVHVQANQVVADLDGLELCSSPDFFMQGGFYAENAFFLDSVRSGAHIAGDIASALQSVEIAHCIAQRAARYAA